MAQRMMWNQFHDIYRGQASDGTVITVDQKVMTMAIRKAGPGVYDSDWWLESLDRVLDHWGIKSRHWMDATTHTPRAHFDFTQEGLVKTQ
jgi:hypothetical protein